LSGKTKPHIFSWLVFLILTFTGFLGQISDNAGPGAWVTGFTAGICLVILILSLLKSRGKVNIVFLDWISFGGACIAMLLSTYVLSGVKYVITLFALTNVSIVTALMPVYLVIINILFVSMLVIRRRQIAVEGVDLKKELLRKNSP